MSAWQTFLNSLDSPGGHLLVLIGLLCLGMYASNMELLVASMGALFALLRSTSTPQ